MFSVLDILLMLSIFIGFIVFASKWYYSNVGFQEIIILLMVSICFVLAYKILVLILATLAGIFVPLSLVIVQLSLLGALYATIWLMGFFKEASKYVTRVKVCFFSIILGYVIYSVLVFVFQLTGII